MHKMLITGAALCCLALATPAVAETVFCTNCSDVFTQALDRVTNVEQLSQLSTQTEQQIQQTVQQIALVKNAIQNTASLPDSIQSKASQLMSQYTQLATLTNSLNTYRGESNALAQVFNKLFPDQSTFADLSSTSSAADIAAANAKYQQFYDNWSKSIDQSCESTFQLSGSQLKDLADSGELQSHIQNLLSTPEGQMQALQAGNALAAIQIQEARQFRELMATKIQSDLTSQQKNQKIDEFEQGKWRLDTKTDKLEDGSGLDDEVPYYK